MAKRTSSDRRAHRGFGELVPALLHVRGMQNRWRWVVLGVVILLALAEYGGLSSAIAARMTSLASQPAVSTAFAHPESGQTDALTALIAFSILGPMAAGAAVVALLLLSKAFEAIVVSVHLPGWLSTPVVGAATIAAIYATSQSWMPMSLYGLGLFARAYFVYVDGPVPIIR